MGYNKIKPKYRKLIAGVDKKVPIEKGKDVIAINFDNAATTPPFNSVLEKIEWFSKYYSSIHRGTGFKSIFSSELYESSKKIVCDFVHCNKDRNTVIYVKNTTEGINKLAYTIYNIDKNSIILSTRMEHHSNDLPWRTKFNTDYVEVDELGKLRIDDLEYKLRKYNGRVKLVCVTGASNVTGYKNPIYDIARLSHSFGAKILVDGAQLVPHSPIYMEAEREEENIDYLVFSAHKMYAPFGIGVLIGPNETFLNAQPDSQGGGTVKLVTDNLVIWAEPPDKNESGSPNIMGVIALVSAINTLNNIGMEKIEKYEMSLYDYALNKLKEIPFIKIYCDVDCKCNKVAILPFNIKGLPHELTAKLLSTTAGIAVRSGCFCAQPYIHRLLQVPYEVIEYYKVNPDDDKRPGMVRLSFGLYNTYKEIDILVKTLKKIVKSNL
ncbi:aminotransferase class V-fold PLP-dependent enzyme [Clostridium sp. DJ247]|uniref:aminotransferase class V-fold PLP-dependent enzyme n=1 Tax=Clostridium sp. DJ247 TaxID=2726188 RepID=UPI00162A0265|nr:aminotransferase class V-fold PLP-dependent enzyme [Clostridium sp. DJ247]MBC2581325.1 aminotransferase class V-fold PLP-dependent enzyme [Clostridium sp. DJ247]